MASIVNFKVKSGIDVAGQINSTLTTGTAPLVIASTTQVANLNASRLGGYVADTGTTLSTIPVRNASGVLPGDIAGNAATATVLATARTINGVSFNGSANISFTTDSVSEGTTNKYFSNTLARGAISATGSLVYDSGTGVVSFTDAVTSVASKTGAVTLAVADISGAAPLASPTFTGTVTTDALTVSGTLTVNGTTTTVNSTVSTLVDPILDIGGTTGGAAPTSNDAKDRGILFQWHNGSVAKKGFFGYDNSTGYFTFVPDATVSSEVISGATGTISAAITGNAGTATALQTARNISGVSFDGTANITLNTSGITENTNLYYTDARARAAISSANSSIGYVDTTGVLTLHSELTAIVTAASTGFLKRTGANTYLYDSSTYLTANQSITLSGDISGTGTTAITTTLPNIVTAGTNTKITYNAKGQVTGGAALASSDVTTALGFTPVNATTLDVSQGGIFSSTVTTTSVTPAVASSLAVATYRSVKYQIQVSSGTNYTVTNIIMIHDDTNVSLTGFGEIVIGTGLGTFDVDITSGNIRLMFTAATSTSTVVRVIATAINI